jgi:hypothetical protein
MGMTYATQPSHDTAFYGPINITFPNNFGVREYNITSAYSLWRSEQAPNYGMAIYSTTVDCNNAAVFFSVSSSDDTIVTERPYLKVYPHNITGVENTLQSNVNLVVYPNPAIEKASLEFTLAEMQQVKCWVYDLNGRAVFSTESIMPKGFNKISIPMSDLAPGLYIYDLTMKEGVVSGKLLRN